MLSNKNNLRSELTANVGVLATTISITAWEWVLWENNMVACLEHYEWEICTKREIIKITAKNNDTFTITRWFAVCIMNDQTKQQGQWSQEFVVGDYLSLYLSKEIWESLTTWITTNETNIQTMVARINAPRTCINNCCQSWKNAIDTAYNTKCGGNAGFGTGADGDCVITEDTFLCANREYNFNNLTICPNVLVRFEWSGVPTINVWDKFINCGCIELKAPYVSNTSQIDCWLEKGCTICNQYTNWGACCGGAGGCNNTWWVSGCPWCPWNSTTWWYGWAGGDWTPWCPPTWCNGWTWACPKNCCNWYGWWWGGWWAWRYWNGWTGGHGGFYWQQWDWSHWWDGGNSGLYWTWWTGGVWWWVYSWWIRWIAWKWWNWYFGGKWWNWWSRWTPWAWWCGVIKWWDGGDAGWNQSCNGWTWWNAITNVYGFHLNARNIWNNCVNARWWNGWNGGNGCWSSCDTRFAYGWAGWNGANGGQMIISYDCMHEQGCFDVRGGEWWLGGWTYACKWEWIPRPSREASWTDWTNGWAVFRSVNNPYITNFNLESDWDNEAILISWEDPQIKQSSPQRWAKTVVRYSTTNYPTTPTDWTLAVEETTRDQYETTPYSLIGVLDETTYYFTAFAIDQNDNIIDVQTNSITAEFEFNWKILDSTVCYYPFLENNSDVTWQTSLSNWWTKQSLWYRFSTSWNITFWWNKLSVFSSFRIKPNSIGSSGNALVWPTDKWCNWYNISHSSNFRNRAQFQTWWEWYCSPTDLWIVWQRMHIAVWFNWTEAYVYKNWVKEIIVSTTSYNEDIYKSLVQANSSYNFDIAYFISDWIDRESEIVSAFNKTRSKFWL